MLVELCSGAIDRWQCAGAIKGVLVIALRLASSVVQATTSEGTDGGRRELAELDHAAGP